MPEQHRPRRGADAVTLTRVHDNGYLVRARCNLCSIKRYYYAADLARLVGDIPAIDLERHLRCEKCGNKEYMDATTFFPTAQERQQMRIRRLAGVYFVRKVIWRDES